MPSPDGNQLIVYRSQSPAQRLLAPVVGLLVLLSGCIGPVGSPGVSTSTGVEDGSVETTGTSTRADGTTTNRQNATIATTNRTTIPRRHPSLESRLVGLVNAENRLVYAAEHGLELRNGRILVVVELEPGREFPSGFDAQVRSRFENLVSASVPVDQLPPLAEHENVSFVRTPRRPVTDSSSDNSTGQ